MADIKLLYLSTQNLQDRLFIKDLVHNFPSGEKIVLFHEAFGDTVSDTRFVTKRISALFSEQMVYNNAFSSDQRGMIIRSNDRYQVNVSLIEQLFVPIQLLILNPVIAAPEGPVLAPPRALAKTLRQQLPGDELFMFPNNPLSPLAAKRPLIQVAQDSEYWTNLFEEEAETLQKALALAPVSIVSPTNYQS